MTSKDSAEGSKRFSEAKDRIIELYNKMDLNEVKTRIEEEYGVLGNVCSYKRWLRKWGIRKNMSPADKLKLLEQCGDSSTTITSAKLAARCRRPISRQNQQYCPKLTPVSNNVVIGEASSWRQSMAENSNFHPIAHPHSTWTDSREFILRRLHHYYSWDFNVARSGVKTNYGHDARLASVFDQINKFLDYMVNEKTLAFNYLNTGCSHAPALFKKPSFQLVVQFVACFSKIQWAHYDNVRLACMSYLVGIAGTFLGRAHELSQILELLYQYQKQEGMMLTLCSQILRMTHETTLKQLDGSNDLLDRVNHLDLLNLEYFQQVGERAYETCYDANYLPDLNQKDPVASASSFYKIGYSNLNRWHLDEAECFLRKALIISTTTGSRCLLKIRMWANNCLGSLCKRSGRIEEAATYYQQALEIGLQPGMLSFADCNRPLEWLITIQNLHKLSGNSEKLNRLEKRYHDMFELREKQCHTENYELF